MGRLNCTGERNQHVLILAGNPREPIDWFRFYVNDRFTLASFQPLLAKMSASGATITIIAPSHSRSVIFPRLSDHRTCDHREIIDRLKEGSEEDKKIESATDMLAAAGVFLRNHHVDLILQWTCLASLTCPTPFSGKIPKTGMDCHLLCEVMGNIDMLEELRRLTSQEIKSKTIKIMGYNRSYVWEGSETYRPLLTEGTREERLKKTFAQPQEEHNLEEARAGPLKDKRVIVTAGPTEEPVSHLGDKISNFSSGWQGWEIARSCVALGAEVTLILGPNQLPLGMTDERERMEIVMVRSAQDMYRATEKALARQTDIFIAAAAVSDFCVDPVMNCSLQPGEKSRLALTQTANIVKAAVTHDNRPAVVVSFAAQAPLDLETYAVDKFNHLGVELTIANPIGIGTASWRDIRRNQVILIDQQGLRRFPEMDKREIGRLVVAELAQCLKSAQPQFPSLAPSPAAKGRKGEKKTEFL